MVLQAEVQLVFKSPVRSRLVIPGGTNRDRDRFRSAQKLKKTQKISDLEISAVRRFDEGRQFPAVLNQPFSPSPYRLLSTFGVVFMCKKHILYNQPSLRYEY